MKAGARHNDEGIIKLLPQSNTELMKHKTVALSTDPNGKHKFEVLNNCDLRVVFCFDNLGPKK